MQRILKSYQKKLTNLTGSNRSLLLLRLSEEQDIDLTSLDFFNHSFAIIEKLLEGKKKIKICPVSDSRDPHINEISGRLKKIFRRDQFVLEERGAKDLYIGWPFVRGKFKDGTIVRCPLLFFSVKLAQKDGQWMLELREDEDISFNKSFLLAYFHYNEVKPDENLPDKTFDEFTPDSRVFRTELYQLLKTSIPELNFNQDLFVNKLEPFLNFRKKDFQESHSAGLLKLYSEAVLGLFPQAGSYLVPDFDYLISQLPYKDMEEFFASKIVDMGEGRNFIKEEQTFTAFRQDSSQEAALREIKKGKSLVVEGPPGTGKSQLISNIISDFISRGKRVLVVCQKRAALDVVYERLKKKELSEFLALVHDFKNDRKKIFEQIAAQIERIDEYQYKNNSLDSIFLEKRFVEVCRRIEQIREELEEFKNALFDESECGISPKELYLTTDPSMPHLELKEEYRHFNAETISKFVRQLKSLLPYAEKFERSDFLWKERISFAEFSISDKTRILHLLNHIPFFLTDISEKIDGLLGTSLEIEEMEWLKDREEQVKQLLQVLEDPNVFSDFIFLLNKNSDKDWFIIREKQIMECFKGSGIEKSLNRDQLGIFQKALEKAWQARRGLIKWIRWRLFSKDNYLIKRTFVANGLQWNTKGFEELMRRVDNRMNLEHNMTELRECGWFQNVPDGKDFAEVSEWFHCQNIALEAKELVVSFRVLKDYLNIPSLSYQDLKTKLIRLLEIISEVLTEKKRWQQYLSHRQIQKILSAFDHAIDLSKILKKDFESLVHYDKFLSSLSPNERAVWNKLLNFNSDAVNSVDLFLNSVKLEWLESLEIKYPVLRTVSSFQMDQLEKEMMECVDEKLKLSSDILLMKAREMTYRDLEFNRLENRVTYRDLQHQVLKKKKIWPLRKLIENFHHEIFKLIPCWLASPDTVSSIFQMDTIFDLVIFDEASQCYSERGIPSICRARQVLITGDSRQLSPSDLYQVRWDEISDDQPELEIDSLLDLGKKFLPTYMLTGHYRSQSLDLIEFSNRHFYKGKLLTIPEYKTEAAANPAIKYIRINGIWEKNTNKAEAEKVKELIREIQNRYPDKSIGIVTFNYPQQNLISDIIEDVAGSENILVRNIENVQGDERDIIIFSTGYAPDESGRFPMNFGSLNAQGGENRLNVAVTRAREKIYIVSSISPDDLHVEDLKNEGPKLLKEYLKFAEEVSEGKHIHERKIVEKSNPAWYLKKKIESMKFSFELSEEIPFADITVKSGQKYKGLILTDDNFYFQSGSVKEVHAYFPELLTVKGWKYKRIFSRLYWEDREKLSEGLEKIFGDYA